jgi:hypothetical protein
VKAFTARYRGKCALECGQPVEPGQVIQYTDEGVAHNDCVVEDRVKRPVCSVCHLQKPCDCD